MYLFFLINKKKKFCTPVFIPPKKNAKFLSTGSIIIVLPKFKKKRIVEKFYLNLWKRQKRSYFFLNNEGICKNSEKI